MKIVRLTLTLLVVCSCSGPQRPPYQGPREGGDKATLADEDDIKPAYGKDALEKALIAERGAEARDERRVAELDQKGDDGLLAAQADLAVRRRFIASLELCQSTGHRCPPRLDDPPWKFDYASDAAKPPLDTPLRFDLDDWQKIAAELHGRACACRTLACIESLDVAIDELEPRPMQDVRADEVATASLTRARECLFRLRGKTVAKPIVEPAAD
jgi:hypothetical protein